MLESPSNFFSKKAPHVVSLLLMNPYVLIVPKELLPVLRKILEDDHGEETGSGKSPEADPRT